MAKAALSRAVAGSSVILAGATTSASVLPHWRSKNSSVNSARWSWAEGPGSGSGAPVVVDCGRERGSDRSVHTRQDRSCPGDFRRWASPRRRSIGRCTSLRLRGVRRRSRLAHCPNRRRCCKRARLVTRELSGNVLLFTQRELRNPYMRKSSNSVRIEFYMPSRRRPLASEGYFPNYRARMRVWNPNSKLFGTREPLAKFN